MASIKENLTSFLQSQEEATSALLKDLIGFHSTVGEELQAQNYVFDHLKRLGISADYAPVDEEIVDDPDYTLVPGHKGYQGRSNVMVNLPGSGGGQSLILNSHIDVVPAPDELFNPRYENGTIYGRGACDAKGCVVTIMLVLQALKELGIKLKGDVQAQILIEEEAGGNGALSAIRQGNKADAVVVVEPTSLGVYPANRGAVWFRLSVKGKSVHMAKYHEGVSALDEMIGLIEILRDYDKKLYEESKGQPLFPYEPLPVKVNIGQIHGGDWPATVPAECWIEGGIGFLPNKRLHQIREEVRQAIEEKASDWAKANYSLEFARLHNDAYAMDIEHPVVKSICTAADAVRGPQAPLGWLASCDARLYFHRGQMPTVVFGPGELGHAHALTEQIKVSEILRAAEALTLFLIDWCGA